MSDLFPEFTPSYLLAFQFSSWYPTFAEISIKSTIVRPLSKEFREYLESDGVVVPDGSEDLPTSSSLSDSEDGEDDDDTESSVRFAFPELDAQIRKVVKDYSAVFPKLNFSSPKDAAWILPASSPLRCTSPSDVYLLLKSSDFISHDLDPPSAPPEYELELVLRKWYPVDRSRELRCFVRQNVLLGISQRDPNYYEFWDDLPTRQNVTSAVTRFWETSIRDKRSHIADYVFDILLTRDLSRAHILDFNPYAPHTDPLLFTYQELHSLRGIQPLPSPGPVLKVIDSRAHPAASRNAPLHAHNMLPLEALSLSAGRGVADFAEALKEEIERSMAS